MIDPRERGESGCRPVVRGERPEHRRPHWVRRAGKARSLTRGTCRRCPSAQASYAPVAAFGRGAGDSIDVGRPPVIAAARGPDHAPAGPSLRNYGLCARQCLRRPRSSVEILYTTPTSDILLMILNCLFSWLATCFVSVGTLTFSGGTSMKLRNVIAAVAFALTCAPALADPATVTFSVIAGAWTDPAPPPSGVPNSGIVITNAPSPGTSQIRWGDPYSPPGLQSGYDFTPAGGGTVAFNFNVPGSSAPGLLGVFNHLNFPIFDPQYLDSVTLNVSAHIILTDASGNHDLGVLNFVFDFTHDETPNGGIPGGPFSGTCPYGPANGTGININGCADRVTVTSNAASQVFNIDGVLLHARHSRIFAGWWRHNLESVPDGRESEQRGRPLRHREGRREPDPGAGYPGTRRAGASCGRVHSEEVDQLVLSRSIALRRRASSTGPSERSDPFSLR